MKFIVEGQVPVSKEANALMRSFNLGFEGVFTPQAVSVEVNGLDETRPLSDIQEIMAILRRGFEEKGGWLDVKVTLPEEVKP